MTDAPRFRFCPRCGGPLAPRTVGERVRLACAGCGRVHYENPIVGVAVVVVEDGRVLLARRAARATYPGTWCIPCGYLEYDEDVEDGARRELREETGLEVTLEGVFAVLSNWHDPSCHTVGVWYRGRRTGGTLAPGDDVEEVGFFDPAAPPPLAFPTDAEVLRRLAASSWPP